MYVYSLKISKLYFKMRIAKVFKIIGPLFIFIIFFLVFLLNQHRLSSRPDVLLITVDALRADHLGCYGYPRNTSPNIDRLAREGAAFLNCFATSSETNYSSVGLLTGRYLATTKYEPSWDNVLDKRFITLAKYLKNFGYETAAFLNNIHFREGSGFEQGFDYFHIYGEKDTKKLNADVLNWLSKSRKGKPLFIWAHYLDPHIPYDNHKEYFGNFEEDKLYKENDRILKLNPDKMDKDGRLIEFDSRGYLPPKAFHKDRYNLNYYIACYDAEICNADFYIGKLLKNIKASTVIILTADHGESLGEHHIYCAHGENIYDEVLHIPLIIKYNRYFKGGKNVPTVVSAIDVVPTILSRIRPVWYLANRNKFDGIDLEEVIRNENIRRKYIYSYYPWAWSIRDINKNIKYILYSFGREELYMLPDENRDLIYNGPPGICHIREELRKKLYLWLKTYPVRSDTNAKRVALDKNTEGHLRNLGYLQ